MAGSVTATQGSTSQQVKRYSLAWTSDASGVVSGTSAPIGQGTIVAVTFSPGSGGTQPTDAYDLTLLCDTHGNDVMGGEGANLSNATSAHTVPFISNTSGVSFVRQWLHGGGYTLTIANAGNAKTGTVDIYVSNRPL
jgi:hypothetical protein